MADSRSSLRSHRPTLTPAAALAAACLWAFAGLAAACSDDPGGDGKHSADANGGGDGAVSGVGLVGLTPDRGPLEGGVDVDLEGVDIGPSARVYFGEVEAEVTWRAGSTHVFATAPAAKVPGPVDVRIVDVDGSATLPNAFAYLGEVRVDAITPAAGPADGGTAVIVEGAGFYPGDRLLVGWHAAYDSEVVDGNTLIARTPAYDLPAGKDAIDVPVAVRHASGVTTLVGSFRYGRPPRLQRVEPAVLGPAGGDVVLLGEGLGAIDALYVDGVAGTLALGDASAVRGASLPSLAALGGGGSRATSVVVSGPYGSATLAPGVVYDVGDGAKLFGVTPNHGTTSGKDGVALLAALGGKPAAQVRFGGASATILVKAPAPFVETPALAAGAHDVELDVGADKLVAKAAFSAFAPPSVAALAPAAGPVAGGTEVVVSGAGLVAGCTAQLGAYAASIVAATGATLTLRTPPGAPGPATLRLRCGPHLLTLADAFAYQTATPQIDAVVPGDGASGGGSLVSVVGAGFDQGCAVAFGGKAAELVEVRAGGRILVRTPPHAPGPVTVQVVCASGADALVDGYTYFSPANPQGGTHGNPAFGTLNVTVLDIYTLKPISGATVVVGQPSEAGFGSHQGLTDALGQVVFVGQDLVPPLTVSAAKKEYSASSIVHFGVANATLLLFPWVPPSSGGGGGGPGLPLATLEGRILDLDKYTLVPPTSCLKPPTGGPICDFCEDDQGCIGEGINAAKTYACVTTGASGKRCFPTCATDDDCDTDFACGDDVLVPGRRICRPAIGIRTIRCETSTRGLESQNPPPGPGSLVDEKTGKWSISARLDELAVYCVAGYTRADNAFIPTSMGVRRHIFPQPASTISGLDLRLDIPLQRTVALRLDRPQRYYPDQNGGTLNVDSWLALGSDGYIPLASLSHGPTVPGTTGVVDLLEVPYQPLTMPAALTDTTQTWRAVVDFGGDLAPIETGTQHGDVRRPGDANLLLRGKDGVWEAEPFSIAMGLAGVLRGPADELLLVARSGRLYRGKLHSAALIFVPLQVDNYSPLPVVMAAAGTPTDATIVGEGGLIRRLQVNAVSSEKGALVEDLSGVCHGPSARFVVGAKGGVAVDRGAGWQLLYQAQTPLRAVACTSDGAIAVGDSGTVLALRLGTDDAGAPTSTLEKIALPEAADLYAVVRDVGAGGVGASDTVVVSGATTIAAAAGASTAAGGMAGGLWRVAPPPAKGANSVVSAAWPAGSSLRPQLTVLAQAGGGTLFGADSDGAVYRVDALGVHDERPERLDVRPTAGVRLDDGRLLLVGDPGLWLGPFLTVPTLSSPVVGKNAQPLNVEWSAAPGTAPMINRVHLDGGGFPFWWLYVGAATTSVVLPDFSALAAITVFAGGPYVARVDRIWVPNLSIDGFSTFDVEFGTWRSWATNGRAFDL